MCCCSLLQAFSWSGIFLTLIKIQDIKNRTAFLQLSHHVSCALGLRLGLGGGRRAPAALDIFSMSKSPSPIAATSPICPQAEPPPPLQSWALPVKSQGGLQFASRD